MLGVSLCALVLSNAFDVQAADDSYVDLSVLNNLQPGDTLFVETQPLFPIVRKDTSASQRVKKAKKKSAAKQNKKAVQVKEGQKEQEVKLNIVPQTPKIPQPLAEKEDKKVESKDVHDKESSEVVEEKKPVQEAEKGPMGATSTITDTKAVSEAPQINQEENLSENKAEQLNQEKPTEASLDVKTKAASKPEAETSKPVETNVSKPILTNSSEDKVDQPIPVEKEKIDAKEEQQENSALTEEGSKEQFLSSKEQNLTSDIQNTSPTDKAPVQPLISSPNSTQTETPEEIRFAEGSYEISDENAQKIISLINTFENPKQNKIAIYAYNYDNGENSFKKKKLSLDRATEIRSLLLNKGYKNFSIKVINVTDSPDKSNLVEIEEIK